MWWHVCNPNTRKLRQQNCRKWGQSGVHGNTLSQEKKFKRSFNNSLNIIMKTFNYLEGSQTPLYSHLKSL